MPDAVPKGHDVFAFQMECVHQTGCQTDCRVQAQVPKALGGVAESGNGGGEAQVRPQDLLAAGA